MPLGGPGTPLDRALLQSNLLYGIWCEANAFLNVVREFGYKDLRISLLVSHFLMSTDFWLFYLGEDDSFALPYFFSILPKNNTDSIKKKFKCSIRNFRKKLFYFLFKKIFINTEIQKKNYELFRSVFFFSCIKTWSWFWLWMLFWSCDARLDVMTSK